MLPMMIPLITSMLQKKQEGDQVATNNNNAGKQSFIQGLLNGNNQEQPQGMSVPPSVGGTGVGKVLGLGALFGR